MIDSPPEHQQGIDLKRGLPMFSASDSQTLAAEKAHLAELQTQPALSRWRGYFRMTGPGWLQSALTLGGGSAMASLFAGAYLQYQLLWVQPVAIILGVIVLAAISHQTLCTGERTFYAMKRILHPALAWTWACGALAVTIIWHFPQYALAAGMTEDIIKTFSGWEPTGATRTGLLLAIGFFFLIVSTAITWSYGSGHKGIRFYERLLKIFVWAIIITFASVVVRQAFVGGIEWGKLGRGFLPLSIPTDPRGVEIVMASFAAAVGINSTFLYPYTLLARGWGREHRGLSRFDLITGTLIPFIIVTSLVIIAAGSTIYNTQDFSSGSTVLPPTAAAAMFESAGLGKVFSRIIFGAGIIGMTLSTITVHMLLCGFAVCELFQVEPGGWRYRLACLLPAPALVGVVFWKQMGVWIAVPTSAICGLLLPIAYVGFFILNNSAKYLGPDKPSGRKALAWNLAMLVAIVVSVASVVYYLNSHFFSK